jgi:hypothetical protein
MKPKAESKLLDVEIDGERGLERLKKLGRFLLATPKLAATKIDNHQTSQRRKKTPR